MSFNTGLSGLRAATADLNTTGNNIANASTTGFKRSRVEFGDIYASNLTESGAQVIGSGVILQRVAQQFNQGTISFTDRSLDVAINGRGFFILSDGGERQYTRAGVFGLDKDGFITSNTGGRLIGYGAAADGTIDLGNEVELRVQAFNLAPNRTTEVQIGFNVDATEAAPDPLLFPAFDPTDQRTFNHASSLTVFDSEGIPHVATLYYRKDQPQPIENGLNNDWSVYIEIDGELINNNPANATRQPTTSGVFANVSNASIQSTAASATPPATTAWEIVFTSAPTSEVTGRDLLPGAALAGPTAGAYTSGADIVLAGVGGEDATVAITDGDTPPITGDTFVVGPGSPPDVNGNQTAFQIRFNTDGTLASGSQRLVIDDWTPAIQNQDVFGSNAEPDGPQGGSATPVFNGIVDDGFSDFVIDITGSTQFGDEFNIDFLRQDGFGPGQLVGTEISDNGTLFARYTNGESLTLGQILLADFPNASGLTPLGNTLFGESFDSGQPVPGLATVGAFGALQAGALEDSNVDLSDQLVRLIIAQRNFQANAKTIETNNTITQTVINIRS
jgi:flagellar hook protein FlgE